MIRIIDGKKYDTNKAVAIADNEYNANPANRLNNGRATTLYRTAKGNFFAYHETCWQGEHDSIEPLGISEAKELFENLSGNPDNWPKEFGEPEEA
jgi:hypothetical protein